MTTYSGRLGRGVDLRRNRSDNQSITWDRFGVSSFPWPGKSEKLLTDEVKLKLALDGWYCW